MYAFIPRSLVALKNVVAKREMRYAATQGIQITIADGMYKAVATNGKMALVCQGHLPTEDVPWSGFKFTPDDQFQVIINHNDLIRGCGCGPEFIRQKTSSVGIATVGGSDVIFGIGADVIHGTQFEGRFPNVGNVVPTTRPLHTFRMDPKLFSQCLSTIGQLVGPDASVDIFFYGKGLPIGLCAKNQDMMVEGLIMPLTVKEEPVDEDEEAPEDNPADEQEQEEPDTADPEDDEQEAEEMAQPVPEPKRERKRREKAVKS